MANHLLHLGVNFKSGGATPERINEIEEVLNQGLDWYRYAPNCWLIYTRQTPQTWHARLQKISWIKPQRYLIVEVNAGVRSGWLSRDAWDWIKDAQRKSEP